MTKRNIYILIAFVTIINVFAINSSKAQCTVNSHDFQYSMTITGELIIDGTLSTDVNDSVFTYVNGECRGSAPVMYNSTIDRYIVMLTVFSNSVSGESVAVKFKDASSSNVIASPNAIIFKADANIGTLSNPYKVTNYALSTDSIEGYGGSSIVVYPNPVIEKVNFNFSGNNVASISILNIAGEVVFEKSTVQQTESIDMSGWKDGVYVVRFQTDKEVLGRKIIKE